MKTKAITEGALLCALAVVIALFSMYVPFLAVLLVFIPVPMVILTKKHGLKVSVVASLAATLILVFFMDPVSMALYGSYMIFVGCSLGYAYNKGKNGFVKLGIAYAGAFLALLFSIILLQIISGQNFIAMLTQIMDESSKDVLTLYNTMGMFSGEQMGQIQSAIDQGIKTMKMTIPMAFLISPFFVGWANVVLSDTILRRVKIDNEPLRSLSQWRVPTSLKNFLITIVIILLALDLFKIEAVPVIYTYTLTLVIYFIYFIMGLSFTFWFINRKRKKESRGLKILVIVGSIIVPIIASLVSIVGVADIYIDIRRFIENRDGTSV